MPLSFPSGRSNGYQLDTTIDTGPRVVGFKLTNSSGGDMFRYGATTLQVNTWYFVAGVYDAAPQTLNVYVNGQLDNGPLVGTITSTQQNSAGKRLDRATIQWRLQFRWSASTTCASTAGR